MERAVTVLDGRWKMMILAHVYGEAVMRYSDLQRAIPAISHKVLSQQLRALDCDGLLARTVHPEVPPRIQYRLTAAGAALEPGFALLD